MLPRILRRSSSVTPLVSALAILALLTVDVASASPARAAEPPANSQISIARVSSASQPSGSSFEYVLNYTCSAVDADFCNDFTIKLPLNSPGITTPSMTDTGAHGWAYRIEPLPGLTATGSVVGSDYVIAFSTPVPTGISQTIKFFATPPNLWTADGTTWSLLPTASGSNVEPFTATDAVVSTATAVARVNVNKTVIGGATSLQPGSTIMYNLEAYCDKAYAPLGSLAMTSARLVDTLPNGMTYVADTANPAAEVVGNTITWSFDGTTVPVPETCRGGYYSSNFTFTARVDDDVEEGSTLTNAATFFVLPVGQTDEISDTAELSLPVKSNPDPWEGGAALTKSAVGAAGYVNGLPETYAGNWITPSSPSPNLDYATVEAQFAVTAKLSTSGFRKRIVDPLPCLDNVDSSGSEPLYVSPAPSDPVCENPAFHPTVLAIIDWNEQGSDFPAVYAAGWRPQVILKNGTTVDVEKTSEGNIGNYTYGAFFAIPASLREQVSQIVLPELNGPRGATTSLRIAGYADASLSGSARLKNTVTVTPYWQDNVDPEQSRTASATLRVIPPTVRLGILKYGPNYSTDFVTSAGSTVATTITVTTTTPLPITSPLVVADLLPIGVTWASPPTTLTWTGSDGPIVSSVEAIDNFDNSGRQLLRFTIPAGSVGSGVKQLVAVMNLLTSPEPQSMVNTAQVFAPDANVDATCGSGTWSNDDPSDLAGDGDTQSASCSNSMKLRTTGSGPPAFSIKKSVKGDLDTLPRFFPAVGVVNPAGGAAQYEITWTNTGGNDLRDVVIYDVLPHVGDTGTLNTQTPRLSAFTPTLNTVGAAPTGATVYYSASYNACRPELLTIPGCVADWSTTPPGGDLANVKAIKITSSSTYVSGESLKFSFTMTVPRLDPSSQIAWNSAAARASFATDGGSSSTPLLPAEGPKVGLQGSYPAVTIVKEDVKGNGGNDPTDPVILAPGATTGLVFHVTNTGNQPLTNVNVTDAVTAGDGTVTGMDCDFRGDGSLRGTRWAGPFPVGATFDCTATLSALTPEVLHTDLATVNATGALLGEPVTASDPYSARVDGTPGIAIVKYVNGRDANTAPGINIAVGDSASWTYKVTNAGDVPLGEVTVRDDNGTPELSADDWDAEYVSGDTNENGLLDLDEVWWFRSPVAKNIAVVAGGYDNLASVTGTPPRGEPVTATDPAHLYGVDPSLSIVKYINGEDANEKPGVLVAAGSLMDFRYVVTNTGNTPLTDLTVTDDQGITVSCLDVGGTPVTELAVDESVDCYATQRATFTGSYTNIGTATARGPETVDAEGNDTPGRTVTDSDPANAYVPAPPAPPAPPAGGLAATGAEFAPFAALATLVLAMGLLLIGLRRVGRRRP